MASNTYIDKNRLKQLSRRSNIAGVWLTLHCWGVIILAGALFAIFPHPLTFIVAYIIICGRQLGMAILMHDAAHGVLFKNKAVNDFVGRYVLAFPIGLDNASYRKYHLQHHLHTQQSDDPDLGLSAAFPTSRASLRRKFTRDMLGITAFKLRAAQIRMAFQKQGKSEDIGDHGFEVPGIIGPLFLNGALLAACALAGVWWLYFALWLLPLMTGFQLVLRIRNIAEHAMTSHDKDPLRHARTTYAGLLERIIVAPYWVHYHIEHHAYMYVPCWQLKALHREMLAAGHGKNMEIRKTYLEVLRLAAPRGYQKTPA